MTHSVLELGFRLEVSDRHLWARVFGCERSRKRGQRDCEELKLRGVEAGGKEACCGERMSACRVDLTLTDSESIRLPRPK